MVSWLLICKRAWYRILSILQASLRPFYSRSPQPFQVVDAFWPWTILPQSRADRLKSKSWNFIYSFLQTTQHGDIQVPGQVARCQNENILFFLHNSVHLDQKLSFHSSTSLMLRSWPASLTHDAIDFINEDCAWLVKSCQLKEYSDEFFAFSSPFRNHRWSWNIEESSFALGCNWFSKHCLPCARRTK